MQFTDPSINLIRCDVTPLEIYNDTNNPTLTSSAVFDDIDTAIQFNNNAGINIKNVDSNQIQVNIDNQANPATTIGSRTANLEVGMANNASFLRIETGSTQNDTGQIVNIVPSQDITVYTHKLKYNAEPVSYNPTDLVTKTYVDNAIPPSAGLSSILLYVDLQTNSQLLAGNKILWSDGVYQRGGVTYSAITNNFTVATSGIYQMIYKS